VLILQEQASVYGTIVDGSGAPVPLARYWARELSWPYQTHGAFAAPLSADRNGHFVIGNMIREGKTSLVTSAIQTGVKEGMIDMDTSIRRLYEAGVVTAQAAYDKSIEKESFKDLMEKV
jgi:hypothetical protein